MYDRRKERRNKRIEMREEEESSEKKERKQEGRRSLAECVCVSFELAFIVFWLLFSFSLFLVSSSCTILPILPHPASLVVLFPLLSHAFR